VRNAQRRHAAPRSLDGREWLDNDANVMSCVDGLRESAPPTAIVATIVGNNRRRHPYVAHECSHNRDVGSDGDVCMLGYADRRVLVREECARSSG